MTPKYDAWDDIQLSPQDTVDVYKTKPESEKDPWDELDFGEGFWKNAFRTALQIPQGVLEATKYGIGTGLLQMLALGETELDIDEWRKLRQLSEQEGIPFDEEAYNKARQEVLGIIPTISNIGEYLEEKTGLPFQPKTGPQKALRFGSMATKLTPGNLSQKAIGGATATGTKVGLEEAGVPEPIAELAGLATGTIAGAKTPVSGIKTKPSGLPERRFESLKKPTEFPAKKVQQINEKLESDFKKISDEIIKESPIGETAENLKNDPTFKEQSQELMSEVQKIADSMPEKIDTKILKNEMKNSIKNNLEGFKQGEYDKSYAKFMKEAMNAIFTKKTTASDLVKQYRKNNASLGEYFEPGSSKALNRAKRDALLDENRAIANVMEKTFPDSELVPAFKEGNARWTKIKDVEAVDEFVDSIFKEKVDFKKIRDFFDKEGYGRTFKKALGEKGYKDFRQLMLDMSTSEQPYKMLKIAQEKGFQELFRTGLGYIIKPVYGQIKLAVDLGKGAYKSLINAMIDKPKIGLSFKRAVDNLKKGNFKEAEKQFKSLKESVEKETE